MNKAYIKDFIAEVYTNKNGSGYAEIPFFNKVLYIIAKEYKDTNFKYLISVKQLFYRCDYEKNIIENISENNDVNNGFVYLTDDYLYDSKYNKTYNVFMNELHKCFRNIIWLERERNYSNKISIKKTIIPSEKTVKLISEKRLYFKHYLYYQVAYKLKLTNIDYLSKNSITEEEINILSSLLPKMIIYRDKSIKENIDLWVKKNINMNTKKVPNLSSYYIFTNEQMKILSNFCEECFETKTINIQKYVMQIKKEV